MKRKIKVYLTVDELMQLDGKCNYGVQKIINRYANMQKRAEALKERINIDEIKEQAITHCVLCRENAVQNEKNNKLMIRLAGYFMGKDENNKPILICKNCACEYFTDIIDNNNENN